MQKESTYVPLYSHEQCALLDASRVPAHVAIIPDGNRRWAKKERLDVEAGHAAGADVVVTCVRAAKELGIKTLTLFTFSTENWARPQGEIGALMRLVERYLVAYQSELIAQGIRLHTIGDTSALPPALFAAVEDTKRKTEHCQEFSLVLALNYGGRDEIARAVKKMVQAMQKNQLELHEVSEGALSKYLDTCFCPDPDLIIRTSGERRMSNFLLWQSSYSEVYIEDDPWPCFTPQHLLSAVVDFQGRHRRLGGGLH